MRSALRAATLLLAVAFAAERVGGQGHAHARVASDSATAAFVEIASRAAEPFIERRAAISAGYRLLGPDFPSMGEHWVNTRILLRDRFDFASPAMLTYVTVAGRPVLAGVVYAVALRPGEALPALPGGIAAKWHEHNGPLEEEAFLPSHSNESMHGEAVAGRRAVAGGSKYRLAVLHVWTAITNPDGAFMSDNWTLPFARLGLRSPDDGSTNAARALSLLSGGDRFYLGLLSGDSLDGESDRERARVVIAAARRDVEVAFAASPRDARSVAERVAALDAIWRRLVQDVTTRVGAAGAKKFTLATVP